ncbi:hypothetical protein DCMF_09085 [Candidatus Formimonas warabiya]|uniref:Molybdopterin-dependent oxidoreductase n=2 Tax=Formimonas warabiya TaxID=1761012 RepID=A0A3G1KR19_FORW1|nr:hypothetical protein DCMF_09085 [Candidatus Formimonas warabiya]
MKKGIVVLICVLVLVSVYMIKNDGKVKADISAYGDTPIKIVGLTENEFTITPNMLAALPCVRRSATSISADVGTVTAVGPLLNTFLARYEFSQKDFSTIRFCAADGYKTVLKNDLLEKEIILSLASGNKPLEGRFQPLRIIIPEAPSSYWTYQVNRIEFVMD